MSRWHTGVSFAATVALLAAGCRGPSAKRVPPERVGSALGAAAGAFVGHQYGQADLGTRVGSNLGSVAGSLTDAATGAPSQVPPQAPAAPPTPPAAPSRGKFCPEGGEAYTEAFRYCPIHGVELRERQDIPISP